MQFNKKNLSDNKNIGSINADGVESMFIFKNFRKNQRNKIRMSSKKCNSTIKVDKLSRNGSETNKYTINQIKICNKK